MTSCSPGAEGACPDDQVCLAHSLPTGFEGNYCGWTCGVTREDDYGRSLTVDCALTSNLIECSDDDPCAAEAGACYEYWRVDATEGSEQRAFEAHYCAQAEECGAEVSDLGRTLVVQCPGEELIPCAIGGGECEAGYECATYIGADDKTFQYCAQEAACAEGGTVSLGSELTRVCEVTPVERTECTSNSGCDTGGQSCALWFVVPEDATETGVDRYHG